MREIHVDILFLYLLCWLISILFSRLNLFALPRKVACLFLSHVYLLVSLNSYACYLALLAKDMYWEEILLVHPNPKPNTHAICVHHIYLYVVFHRHSKVNCLCATFKTFKNTITCFVLFIAHGKVVYKTIVVRNMLLMYFSSYKLHVVW